jgi:hypothetical protein
MLKKTERHNRLTYKQALTIYKLKYGANSKHRRQTIGLLGRIYGAFRRMLVGQA